MLKLLPVTLFILIGSLSAQTANKPTNVVVIFADDLGWADLSCYGSTFYETPNLDKLAAQGIRFTNNYASCPVCSPTRASMMTGKYPVKTGVTDWIKGRQADNNARQYEKLLARSTGYQLELHEKTIAELALQKGYKTFFAGKWHLGEEEKYWPGAQGFQINKGGWSKGSPTGKINDSTGGYFTPYQNPMLPDGPKGEYITDRLADECLQFIDKNNTRPFLLMYSLYAVHNPLQAPAALIKKYEEKKKRLALTDESRFKKDENWMRFENGWKRRVVQDNAVYAAMIENMDMNIGRIMEKLKQLGLDENTLVIFTSDNGGLSTAEGSPTVNGPYRAGKGWLYEGGVRVPLIMRWPGKMPAGQVSAVPTITNDFYPTIAAAIQAEKEIPKAVDGTSVLKLLANPGTAANRSLYWHYPHYSNQGGKPGSSVLQGNYKLILNYEDNSAELYNLSTDKGEQHDLSAAEPAMAAKLKQQLQSWLQKVKATYPVTNPKYDPAAGKPLAKQDDE